jgi:hypothetical protein
MICEENESKIVVCDRGTLDGLAYWPESPESYFAELSTSLQAELARYCAVIHLRTPLEGHGYNHRNPLRTEDAAVARAIDEKIAEVWAAHPNRTIVNSSEDFMEKAARAFREIKKNLPGCCNQAPLPLRREALLAP